ncbi:hypothetical protein [Streptosporangium sp. NPDC006930]|uniref:hypothetical protein n=1 Tax=Streptosporangium sp. NPDC006930 TaxID=3154783 RepID=UPI00342CD970
MDADVDTEVRRWRRVFDPTRPIVRLRLRGDLSSGGVRGPRHALSVPGRTSDPGRAPAERYGRDGALPVDRRDGV